MAFPLLYRPRHAITSHEVKGVMPALMGNWVWQDILMGDPGTPRPMTGAVLHNTAALGATARPWTIQARSMAVAEVADGDTGQRVQSLLLLRFLLHKWLDQPFTSQAPATLLPCPQRLYTSLARTTLPTIRHLLLLSRAQCRLRSRPHLGL